MPRNPQHPRGPNGGLWGRPYVLRLSPAQRRDLDALAATYGRGTAHVLRTLIAQKAEQLRLADALVEPPAPEPALAPVAEPPADDGFVTGDAFSDEAMARAKAAGIISEAQRKARHREGVMAGIARAKVRKRAALGLPPEPTVIAPQEALRCPTCRTLIPLDHPHVCIGCPRCRKPITVGTPHTCDGFVFP